jgi:hypothetical protein
MMTLETLRRIPEPENRPSGAITLSAGFAVVYEKLHDTIQPPDLARPRFTVSENYLHNNTGWHVANEVWGRIEAIQTQ